MLSGKRNVLQLVALMREHHIHDVVLCPGSRDIPLAQTLSHVPEFRCYSMVDERSAGFFALGLAVRSKAPAAVVVTSGSALANLHPAVCEAYYQQVPLLVISADRAAAWIGQMDGQTMPQAGFFRNLVRCSVNLPEINIAEDEWHCNRMINEALLALDHEVRGPVHINVPISDPFFDFPQDKLPEVRVISRMSLVRWDDGTRRDLLAPYPRILVVWGQNTPDIIAASERKTLSELTWLFAEHLGNWDDGHHEVSGKKESWGHWAHNSDWLLDCLNTDSDEAAKIRSWLQPDLVITIGGHIISKRLKKFLRAFPPKAHWQVSPTGEIADLFKCLTTVVTDRPEEFVSALASSLKNLQWVEQARAQAAAPLPSAGEAQAAAAASSAAAAAEAAAVAGEAGRRLPEVPRYCHYVDLIREIMLTAGEPEFAAFSSTDLVGKVLQSLPPGSTLHLANSSAVRSAQFHVLPEHITVMCNRGIDGIEGSVSAAVGAAYWEEQQHKAEPAGAREPGLHLLIIGDLSFYYDFNGLWLDHLPHNLRILLLNNRGGEIFRNLPGLALDERADLFVRGVHNLSGQDFLEARFKSQHIDYQVFDGSSLTRDSLSYSSLVSRLTAPVRSDSRFTLVEYLGSDRESASFRDSCKTLRQKIAAAAHSVMARHGYLPEAAAAAATATAAGAVVGSACGAET